MFKRNLKTKPSDEEEVPEERLELEATEISREEDRSAIGEFTYSSSLCILVKTPKLGLWQ